MKCLSFLSEHAVSTTDKDSPVLSNDVKETSSNTASFMISPDDLDIFVNEQMRKTSISQGMYLVKLRHCF